MDLSHIVLQVGLCSAIARAQPDTTVPLRVQMTDRAGIPRFDKVVRFQRGDDDEKVVEFDVPPGTYRLDLGAPQYRCTYSRYVDVISETNRTIAAPLVDGPSIPSIPILLSGKEPESFLYVHPTFVLIDKSVACDKPVGDPVVPNAEVENEGDSYYVSLYADPSATPQTLALRLQTPTHQYHYVRLPGLYPPPPGHWPNNDHIDVSEDLVDALASRPVDTLLCVHFTRTTVQG